MVNWYDIIEPHQDIKIGNYDESVFAADLGDVIAGTAQNEYKDPLLFLKKTYFTKGIINLLIHVYKMLSEGKGSSIIEIKTAFGGGKTHSLIAIYQFIKNTEKFTKIIPEITEPVNAKIGVVVGTHLNPLEGNTREGVKIQTLWGEIAYQIGGLEAYKEFENNDRERIAPGKEKLKSFLSKYQPFVLLFDEVLQYITKANGISYSKTNLGSQTFAFLQELTETIAAIPKGIMVVTLPSSVIEDYTIGGEESLSRLNKIFGRLESIETPVQGEEIYSIIVKRLFDEIKNEKAKENVISKYFQFYQDHKDDFPSKIRDKTYLNRMLLSYPFLPEVIDILYERWGTFSTFQRTRGLLRLLANVIEDLYTNKKVIDLILPADINLGNSAIRQELLAHIGSEYEGIIASDIAGHNAKSLLFDRDKIGWNGLAEKISISIFFSSFSVRADKGLTLDYIKLFTNRPEMIPTLTTEVTDRLKESLWYLNEKNNNYFFSKIPNLNRMIVDKKNLYEDVYLDQMKSFINREIGKAFSSYLWPMRTDDIPDNKELKLVILHPNEVNENVQHWIESKGPTFRIYKNTIILAIADPVGFASLKDQIQIYLALKEILSDVESGIEESLEGKTNEIRDRMTQIQKDLSFNIRRMYNTIIMGDKTFDLGQPKAGNESLSNWYKAELLNKEKIIKNLHYRVIINKFLSNREHLETKLLVEQFYKDISLFIPETESIIRKALQDGITDGAIGIAYIMDNNIDYNTFKYKTNISINSISFNDNEILISKGFADKILEDMKKNESSKFTEEEINEQANGNIESPLKAKTKLTLVTKGKEKERKQLITEEAKEKEQSPTPTPSVSKKYKKIFFRVENID